MKAGDLLSVLMSKPLSYTVDRQKGSHRTLTAEGRPPVRFSYHDGATVPPGVVRKILVYTVGLDEREALRLL
jgi:predicted RNA binding protein YcfA (HicA-like mRNA interferase family)